MQTFLARLAEKIYTEHPGRLDEVCIVFPTRRAGLYFKKETGKLITTPQWAPVVFSIQDFIRSQCSAVVPDRLELIITLYQVYKKYIPDEQFDSFYPWGEMLLNDFDEIDRNLADGKKIFAFIRDMQALDESFSLAPEELELLRRFWKNIATHDEGMLKTEFLKIWSILGKVYEEYQIVLTQQNICYEGLAFRRVAEGLQQGSMVLPKAWKMVIFAGFYALSESEKLIFSTLEKQEKAKIFWDADQSYCDNTQHEAGLFFRRNIPAGTDPAWKENYFKTIPKKIEITGVPLQVGQAKAIGEKLHLLLGQQGIDPEKTAVVLPDEQMLFPVLYSLPETISSVNVTMGYPLHHTPLFRLVEGALSLLKNVRQKDGETFFYHRDVLFMLRHPYIFPLEQARIQHWLKTYEENTWILIPLATLTEEQCPSFFREIFRIPASTKEMFGYFLGLLKLILTSRKETSHAKEHRMEAEYISVFYTQLHKLSDITEKHTLDLSPETLANLLREIIYATKIPFTGEPLKGLQVMGFLETRVLDFENIFILSVNETVLPASSPGRSFIPYSIRRGFGLPAHEDADAISAYHFYRLLQRAKNIYLYYNTEVKSLSGGEKSRFLLQIEHELAKKFSDTIHLSKHLLTTEALSGKPKPISVIKTDAVMSALNGYILKHESIPEYAKRFSATALISYIECPLKFYYRYVAGLKEVEDVEENIEAATFGTILHGAMQLMYENSGMLTASDIESLKPLVNEKVEKAMREVLIHTGHALEGKNLLLKEVLAGLVSRILNEDKKRAPFHLVALEAKSTILYCFDGTRYVCLHGIIDRVDEKEGVTQVIDYKTGRSWMKKENTPDECFTDPKLKAAFQTYYYAWLYRKKYNRERIAPAIYPVRNLSEGLRYLTADREITPGQFENFEIHLKKLITGILNPAVPFMQTEDTALCTLCAYRSICHR